MIDGGGIAFLTVVRADGTCWFETVSASSASPEESWTASRGLGRSLCTGGWESTMYMSQKRGYSTPPFKVPRILRALGESLVSTLVRLVFHVKEHVGRPYTRYLQQTPRTPARSHFRKRHASKVAETHAYSRALSRLYSVVIHPETPDVLLFSVAPDYRRPPDVPGLV